MARNRYALTLFFSILVSGAIAQQPEPARESLLIGRGDLLYVHIVDTPELEQHPRVEDSGKIPLTGAGQIDVAGLTPAKAASQIQQAYVASHYLNHPQVSVTIEQYATQHVSIIGQVKAPGTYAIVTPRSVIDVLALAGGITDVADRNITIERHGDSAASVSYNLSNNPQDAMAHQVLVYPGDTLMVPKAGIVYVLGDVNRPGGFVMQNNSSRLTVLQVIAMAGGTAHSAVPAHTRLMRKSPDGSYEEQTIQLSKMQEGKIPDLDMNPGDVMYIPFSYVRNIAVGSSGIVASATSATIYAH